MSAAPRTVSIERLLAEEGFDDLTFEDLDLAGVDLGGKEFTGCTFRRCKAPESLWRRARLDECAFEGCDLTRMQPRGMSALELRFTACKLMGVEWTELGHLPRLAFTECVLDFASFIDLDLRGTAFTRSQIVEANFFGVDLREASFAGSELRGAVLRGCKLERADLSGALGLCFDPAANDARGALISIETAALLAMQAGLRVDGFSAAAAGSKPARAGARTRRR